MEASSQDEKTAVKATADLTSGSNADVTEGTSENLAAGSQALHRKLRGKEVQLFAIGGAIGTCKFFFDFFFILFFSCC